MKNVKSFSDVYHCQKNKYLYVIRNSSTGAYLCDAKLRRRIFKSYREAENELKRLRLNIYTYETEVLI